MMGRTIDTDHALQRPREDLKAHKQAITKVYDKKMHKHGKRQECLKSYITISFSKFLS